MSSTYAVLCLSHDPAVIAADGGWQQPEAAERAIEAGIEGHEQCDLLLGRYSYPLVELGCPTSGPKREGQAGSCYHRGTRWADIDWIRLLFVAQQQEAGTLVRMTADKAGRLCWTPERLRRLRMEIGPDFVMRPDAVRPVRDCGKDHVHDAHEWDDFDGGEYGCIGIPARPASPAPCSINHDCPGQPRPEPLTARGEARCQSQHRRGDGPLVQCAKAVHPKDEVHTDYDQDMFWPPRVESAGLPWLVWSGA